MAIHDLHEFPYDVLAPYAATARAHPDGLVDLSIGNPVDPVPDVVRRAIVAATDAHAYPLIEGTGPLLEAIVGWYARRRGVDGLTADHIIPTIGSKELVALLPLLLGVGPGDVVVHPRAAYPSYATGAQLVGATALASDDPASWPDDAKLIWINSPGNPDGRVLSDDQLREAVRAARRIGAVLASDECYLELGWGDEPVPTVLHPDIAGGDLTGLLSVYSLSKQSNLAGYRGAWIAGDPGIVGRVLEGRKHLGLMPPAPVQAAMIAALGDDEHVARQKSIYRERRALLRPAIEAAGFRIDHSDGGLYLWATEGRDAWESVGRLAEHGILAIPGHFYGEHFPEHVRFSLTAPDERIAVAAARLHAGVGASTT